ncbi:MAG: NERD domain-containing protein [Caldiserica bacterium]|nr:NERD domain-containing protein [Caldisericota bacterium]
MARTAGIVVNEPSDVGIQLARAQKMLYEEETLARDDLALQQSTLEQDLEQKRSAATEDIARIRARSEQDLKRLSARFGNLRSGVAPVATRAWIGLSRLSLQGREHSQIRARSRAILPAQRALQDFLDGRETEVARRVEGARRIALGVEAIAHSATLANAIAERNVIRTLGALADDFVLMNDLHLHSDHDVPFENGYLKTARLGHLLAGPAGIYAIETRSWSRTAIAAGEEADPVLQVARASFLCTHILKDAGCNQIVRSIVASEGAAPTRSGGAHVAVVPAARLLAYIQYGPRLMSVQDIADVCRILS